MSEKQLNIIILDAGENIIEWLDSDKVDIVETNKIDSVRSISMTVPLEDGYAETNPWFTQGNKIFIPNTLGIKSCLYVINTDYNIDYLEKNMVQIEAEEVLTELNYEVIDVYPDEPIEVTATELAEWFGEYYEIGEIDPPEANQKTINPYETLTLMDLFRMIEEKTNRVFITEYSSTNNIINRTLHLKSIANLRTVAKTEYIDLNWNLKSLDLEVSEENTYTAMAPILSRKDSISTQSALLESSSNMVSATDSLTSENLETKEDALAVLNAWKEHEVVYRDYIPMICEKQQDGSVNYTAYWYAPFEKRAGDLFIRVPNETDANYSEIIPRYVKEGNVKINPKFKVGTVTTSETDPNAIYNVCANKLLDKLHPVFKLKVEVEDIQDILGINSLGYTLYETLYVRPPRFTYFVPCYVTETKKNPHMPGSNTITVETDIKGLHQQQETEIISNDVITSANEKETQIGGLLLTDTTGIADGLISINIRLQESFTKVDYDLQQQVEKFSPETETYTFTEEEIQRLEKKLHKDLILKKIGVNYYNMRAIDGKLYAVPYKWAESIYNTRNQAYINSDDVLLNAGKFKKSITVHYYPNNSELLAEHDNVKYYPSYFYDYYSIINTLKNADADDTPTVVSSEHQTGPNCLPAAVSNISSYFKEYHTEGELKKIFNTTNTGTPYDKIIQGLDKLGYTFSVVPFTKENIETHIQATPTVALVLVKSSALGYTNSGESHAVVIIDWSYTNGIENMKCVILDSNKPLFNPRYAGQFNYGTDSTRTANELINACAVEYQSGTLKARESGLPVMIVINPPLTYEEDDEIEIAEFKPDVQSYTFSAESIEKALKTLPSLIRADRTKDYFTQNVQMTDVNGKIYNVPGKWVMSLAYAYMYYYRNNWTYVPELKFKMTDNGAATKYYNHLDTDYGWFTPCYPEKADKPVNYTVSTILFYAGFIVPPGKLTINDDYVSYSDYGTIVNQNSNNLHYFVVDATKQNIKKYLQYANTRGAGLFNVQVILKVKSDDLDNLMQSTYSDSYQQRMYGHYTISIWEIFGDDQVTFLLTNGNGNSPTNRYDVTFQNSTTSPWRTASIDTVLSWHENAQSLQNEDVGKMLVVSMFSQSEIDSWRA